MEQFRSCAKPSGGLVGLTVGYNWQALGSPWVFGIEGDINWSDMKGSFANVACPFGCQIKSEWFGTVRGRVGYAVDRVMPYVTGGLADGDVSANIQSAWRQQATPTSVGRSVRVLKARWPELDRQDRVSLHGSRQHDLRRAGLRRAGNVDFTSNIVRAGVNYKF